MLELIFDTQMPIPSDAHRREVWSRMEATYKAKHGRLVLPLRRICAGSMVAFLLGVIVVTHAVTRVQTKIELHTLNADLSSMDQEINNDPFINNLTQGIQ